MAPLSQAAVPPALSAASEEHPHTTTHAPKPFLPQLIADFRELFKVRVTGMVIITGWAGFYLGSMQSGISSLQRGLLDTIIGIGLLSAGSGALNQVIEYKSDAFMRRTADRPLSAGRFSRSFGLLAGLGALALGAGWLAIYTNLLTVALALLTAFTYVAIYTPLKRLTTTATFIGAFPGAMGPVLGWTAVRDRLEWPAVALFAILFVWQFPHFMAIAWMYREDYGRAGIKMLPVVQPRGRSTVLQALFYALLMVPISVAPWYLGMTGLPYAILAALLSLVYLGYTIRFARILQEENPALSRKLARDLLKVSVLYLPLLMTALMLGATAKH